jgi:hypothetical protein
MISFSDSIGLRVNYNKSLPVPINIDNEKAKHLEKTIVCSGASVPFTYFGLPLGTARPSVDEFPPFLAELKEEWWDIISYWVMKVDWFRSIQSFHPTQHFTYVPWRSQLTFLSKLIIIKSIVSETEVVSIGREDA